MASYLKGHGLKNFATRASYCPTLLFLKVGSCVMCLLLIGSVVLEVYSILLFVSTVAGGAWRTLEETNTRVLFMNLYLAQCTCMY